MAEFQVNGTTLYYEVLGDENGKETIAFLNGVMASASSWALLYPIFEKLGFRVILHDFKGQLKSGKPEGPYTFGTYLWAEFENLAAWEKKLVEGPYIHHMAEIEGDYTEELAEFCKYVPGLSLDTVK